MNPIVISATTPHHPGPTLFRGWLVPDTAGLLGIDQRWPADPDNEEDGDQVWLITHLPTGRGIAYGSWTRATTQEQAAAMAQRFYAEWTARGWDLSSADFASLRAPYLELTDRERGEFWDAVCAEATETEGAP